MNLVIPFGYVPGSSAVNQPSDNMVGRRGSAESLTSGVYRKPSEVLMENSSDRPDVANVAWLGYN